MDMQTARLNVQRGINVLDRNEPNWREAIDCEVRINDTEACILSYVFGGYLRGLEALFGERDSSNAIHCGFEAPEEETEEGMDRDYVTLQAAWDEELYRGQ